MTLIKTGLLNGIAVGIRTLTMLALNKLLAIYVGPSGYAVIGQFQNFVQMATVFGSGAINTGVAKYTAEYFDDVEAQHRVWRSAGTISLLCSLVLALAIAIFHRHLAALLLNNEQYGSIFLWLSATVTMFVFNGLLLAILIGKKEIVRYVTINICGSLFSLLVTGALAYAWGLFGALVSLAIYPSLTFLVTVTLVARARWFSFRYLFGGVDKGTALNLSKFVLMAAASGAALPIAQILIRNHLGSSFGWDSAGLWEALVRLSNAYLTIFMATLSLYYLPRFSEIREPEELRREILQGYRVIIPLVCVSSLAIYLLRDWIVALLFSREFAPMRDLFAWQMAGDVIKMASWLLGYVLIAKAMVATFVVLEFAFSLFFVGATMGLTPFLGLEGVVVAYALHYVVYLALLIFVLRKSKVL